MIVYATPALRLVLASIVAVLIMTSNQGRGAAEMSRAHLHDAAFPAYGIMRPAGVRR